MRFDYQVVSDFNYLNKDIRVDLGQHIDQAIFQLARCGDTRSSSISNLSCHISFSFQERVNLQVTFPS